MKNETNEFSFVLKPSRFGGVGVFAVYDIPKGTYLRWTDDCDEIISVIRNIEDVPEEFQDYCIYKEDGKLICPKKFNRMHFVWYLNHSKEYANAIAKTTDNIVYKGYTSRDIKAGEEIFIDYNVMEEPKTFKSEYYKK